MNLSLVGIDVSVHFSVLPSVGTVPSLPKLKFQGNRKQTIIRILHILRIMQVMRGRHHQSELVVVRIVRFDFLYLELYEKNVICKGWGYVQS